MQSEEKGHMTYRQAMERTIGKQRKISLKCWKKHCQLQNLHPMKISSKNEREIKHFQKTKAERIVSSRPPLQNRLKEILSGEKNDSKQKRGSAGRNEHQNIKKPLKIISCTYIGGMYIFKSL